jgi:hypothetical protein
MGHDSAMSPSCRCKAPLPGGAGQGSAGVSGRSLQAVHCGQGRCTSVCILHAICVRGTWLSSLLRMHPLRPGAPDCLGLCNCSATAASDSSVPTHTCNLTAVNALFCVFMSCCARGSPVTNAQGWVTPSQLYRASKRFNSGQRVDNCPAACAACCCHLGRQALQVDAAVGYGTCQVRPSNN